MSSEQGVRGAFRDDYQTQFSVQAYLEAYYPTPSGSAAEGGDVLGIILKFWMRVFQDNLLFPKRHAPVTQLDFGSGPCIHQFISAARQVKSIVAAEWASQSREYLKAWKLNDPASPFHFDWLPLIRHVVASEGLHLEEDARQRVESIRNAITDVISGDALADPIVEAPFHERTYDIVTTSLCLEAACKTFDEYKAAVKKLGKLVARHGTLAIVGVLLETFYMVGNETFFCLKLSEAQIREALAEAGFDVVYYLEEESSITPEQVTVSDMRGLFGLVAKRRADHITESGETSV